MNFIHQKLNRPSSKNFKIMNDRTFRMGIKHTKSFVISLCFSSLLIISLFFLGKAIATDTVTQSEGISFGQNLVSSNEVFKLGFFSPGNSTKKYIGIWYKNISARKIVWVANRENPIAASDTASSLIIGKNGNLILLDSTKNIVWSTNVSSQLHNRVAVLSDNGNLILKDIVTGFVSWESFNYPGDISIAGITLGPNPVTGSHYLSSWKTENDPSNGIFLCGITSETPPQVVVLKSSKTYWKSGPWDGSKFIGLHKTGVGYANGIIVIQNSPQGSSYIYYSPPSPSHVAIIHLTVKGNLVRSDWDLVTRKGGFNWQSMDALCDVYGTCGNYGVCNRKKSNSCECLNGFVPNILEEWKKGNWTSGCVRRTELFCEKNTSIVTRKAKKDGFLKIRSAKVPDNYKFYFQLDPSDCEKGCLKNCSCKAYAYPAGIGCLMWNEDLIDTHKFSSGGADLFLRLAYTELGKKRNNTKIIISLATMLGVILLCVFSYCLRRWNANKRVKKRHQEEENHTDTTLLLGSNTESSDILVFDFNTLAVATESFSETNKLGAGGFGPVYKGKLEDGKDIAVKRLSINSGQGAEEFKNEILMISKLQHRNLVKLLGYCIKKDEKLLIYEYLKNKSLDTLLFDAQTAIQLDWEKRLNIIHGIARGLLYLHRDSLLRIIHRDLKASNILLDDNTNPKISDFGLARSFQITQEQANTNRVVGTFGYMSPEYAMGGLVSEKSDVYSFGILLLEIISGMRITSLYDDGKYNLLCYAWHLWEEGKALEFMDETLFSSCPDAEFIQCMHIGLLCVQDHSIDRPTIPTVILMLTSEMEFPQPKPAIFYKTMVGFAQNSQSSRNFYIVVDENINVHQHTHRHTGSQPSQRKDLHTTQNQDTKIKST